MATYRVREQQQMAHNGAVLTGGAVLELPRAVAEDHANIGALEEIDGAGQPVAPRPVDDLDRFRTHERVGMLRDRLTAAKAQVTAIEQQLAAEEQRLADDVAAARTSKAPTPAVVSTLRKDD